MPYSWMMKLLDLFKTSKPAASAAATEQILAVLPLKDAVLMPGALLPLLVTNQASIKRIQELHAKGEAMGQCHGINSCKGKSECATGNNGCGGQPDL